MRALLQWGRCMDRRVAFSRPGDRFEDVVVIVYAGFLGYGFFGKKRGDLSFGLGFGWEIGVGRCE